MGIQLREALRETLADWYAGLDPVWQEYLGAVELDFDAVDGALTLESWEPIFPPHRDRIFPGAPAGAHILRAFDGLSPQDVRCVIVGQDPYPCPAFSTGRAFEAGNVSDWRELDKMFSKSVRAFIQLIVAARTDKSDYAENFGNWPGLLGDIEAGRVGLETPELLADRWVNSGVLLLNSSLTLSRFKIEIDAHQAEGHLPLWRPLIREVLQRLSKRGTPIVFIGFGDAAAENLALAGLAEGDGKSGCSVILRPHPAAAEAVLKTENPFLLCNEKLEGMGGAPVRW